MNHLVATCECRRDIQRPGDRLGGPRYAARLGENLGGAKQRLGRHARVERALTADRRRLHDRDAAALRREVPRDDLPRRPRTDNDHVEGFDAHIISLGSWRYVGIWSTEKHSPLKSRSI